MTDDQAPPPLKSNGETPAELVRALNALGRTDARDLARLARVGAKLEAASLASSASSGWLQSLIGSKASIIGIVIGAIGMITALGAIGYSLRDRAPEANETPKVTPPKSIPAPLPSIEEPTSAREPVAKEAPAPSMSDRDVATPRAARDHVRPPRTAREPRGSKPVSTVIDAPTSSEPVEPRQPARIDQERADEAEAPIAPADEPADKAADKPALPLSEAALIYKARSVAADEPNAALRLLEEHAQRFPNGTLVPEREVLAIEVLRRIGRHTDAARRLRAFEARYPGSIHLRRLAPDPE